MFNKITLTAIAAGMVFLGACEAASDTPDKIVVAAADAGAATTAAAAPKTVDIAAIREKFPAINPDDIRQAAVAGWYEIDTGGKVLYVSADGDYALQGDLIDLNTRTNLTDLRRNTARKNLLSGFEEDDVIVFKAAEKKHTITVFTDIDCGYCRKLHKEIDQLNNLGIEVRYMFFPRSGPNTPAWEKATTVWCSDDRNAALTAAKNGERLAPQQCDSDQIAAQYETGRKVGLRGTPAIVTEKGELIAGYLPAQSLLNRLEQGIK